MKAFIRRHPIPILFLTVCLLISIPLVSVCYPSSKGASFPGEK